MIRDLVVALFVLGSLPFCFRRPYIGLLVFSVLAYMRIQDLTWGFARQMRWSYYVAIVTAAGYVLDPSRRPAIWNLRTFIMLGLVLWIFMGIPFRRGSAPLNFPPYLEYTKIVVVSIFTTAVVQRRSQLRMLIWVIAMSFAFYGVKTGIAGVISLGSLKVLRGPGGMLEDNNDFALAMAMAVPLLLHLAHSEKRPLFRKAVLATVPLTMITVIVTHSRGGALAMATGMAVLVWRSRNRIAGIAIGFLLVISAVIFAPKEYVERLKTIRNYQEDGSAMGRLAAWKVAGNMIVANPLFGVGMDRFRLNYLDYDYEKSSDATFKLDTRVAHNSYLQIWAENGTPVLFMYLLLVAITVFDLWRIRKQARQRYHASWILNYATMFEAAFATFIVGGIFLNRAHFDLIYHYITIVLVFTTIAREEMANELAYPQRTTSHGPSGPLTLIRSGGFGAGRRSAPTLRDTPLLRAGR